MVSRRSGARAALFLSMLLLAACADDAGEMRAASERLGQENQRLARENATLLRQLQETVSSFHEQCLVAGFDVQRKPDAAGEKPAAPSHPQGACLDCHESHGKPDCTSCHEMEAVDSGVDVAGAPDAVAPSYPQPVDTPRVGDIDGVTGASGDYYYSAGSYLDVAYLASRVNGMRKVYSWEPAGEGEEGVDSLALACELPESRDVRALFPDDGKRYRLRAVSNQQGAKLVSTVNRFRDSESGEWVHKPNIATFGYGLFEEDGRYFVELNVGKNNSCHNAIGSGDMRFSYYEYDPGQADKGLRNRGARIIGRVDYKRTSLKGLDWKSELPGFGAGEQFAPADVDWEQVAVCSLVVEVVGIIPLG